MNIKGFATALLVSLIGMPALATELGSFEDHKRLYDTIHSYGVKVLINSREHCSSNAVDGLYDSRGRVLVICQDNARGTREVDWTANDYDTLRHEAHHMIQDCAHGQLADSYLAPLFGDEQSTLEFIHDAIGESYARQLMNNSAYVGREYVHLTEMEAFATAAVINANTIADKMDEMCSR